MNEKRRCLLVTAVWGEWHTRVFTTMNLPSLLAPGNLPEFCRRISASYVIYTPPDCAAAIAGTPAFKALSALMPIEIVDLAGVDLSNPIDAHVDLWSRGAERARREGSFILTVHPDFVWADGAFATIAGLLEAGRKAIYFMCIRVVAETFETDVQAKPAKPTDKPAQLESAAIRFAPRELMALTIKHMHPLHAAYLRDSGNFPQHMEYVIWPVEGEGFIMRLFANSALCLDLNQLSLDPNCSLAHLDNPEDIAFIDDSDDMYAVSLTPLQHARNWYFTRRHANADEIGAWWLGFDGVVQRRLAARSLRFHTGDRTEAAWRRVERQSDFFVHQITTACDMVRLCRTLDMLGCRHGAELLATALYGNRLRRKWLWAGPVTVFCPGDDAFAALGETGWNALLAPENADHLFAAITAHVVNEPLNPPNHTGIAVEARTIGGGRVVLETDGPRLTVNGRAVSDHVDLPHGHRLYLIDGFLTDPPRLTRRPGRRAVFLDRDGVVNRAVVREGKPYPPDTVDELEVLPGVADAIAALRAAGFLVVIVTNQPDVATGRQTRAVVEAMHDRLFCELGVDDIRVCYHTDADGCSCRKPRPGMLVEAARDWHIDLTRSHLVGDRWRDIAAGRAAGCTTHLIDYGYAEPAANAPDHRVPSLSEAAGIILATTTAKARP